MTSSAYIQLELSLIHVNNKKEVNEIYDER